MNVKMIIMLMFLLSKAKLTTRFMMFNVLLIHRRFLTDSCFLLCSLSRLLTCLVPPAPLLFYPSVDHLIEQFHLILYYNSLSRQHMMTFAGKKTNKEQNYVRFAYFDMLDDDKPG